MQPLDKAFQPEQIGPTAILDTFGQKKLPKLPEIPGLPVGLDPNQVLPERRADQATATATATALPDHIPRGRVGAGERGGGLAQHLPHDVPEQTQAGIGIATPNPRQLGKPWSARQAGAATTPPQKLSPDTWTTTGGKSYPYFWVSNFDHKAFK